MALSSHVLAANEALADPLTRRELEVLTLIAEGYTNRQIADRLFIGVSTVKKHINHIYNKLDVQDRAQAADRAAQLNILP
jgi:LuxR family transcriptional regulator, maltose regulon positive regulatory protein